MKSTSFSFRVPDFIKGAIMAIGTPVIYLLQQMIPSWQPWLTAHFGAPMAVLIQTGLSAFIAYIIKQYFSNNVKTATNVLTEQGATIIPPKTIVSSTN